MVDSVLNYLEASTVISIGVLVVLSLYFIFVFWIFIYKYFNLSSAITTEKNNLGALLSRETAINPLSRIGQCVSDTNVNKESLRVCETTIIREASSGISGLSIISSTAPFIGLFGTVVGILESFSRFATTSKVSFSTIAPAISEALIATAAGIFVAIFAYSFHQILTRQVYELNTYIKSQIDVILSRS